MASAKSTPKTRTQNVPCDFCTTQIAILYCSADSAKLCLFCDQLVHSANSLSRKHVRSQICDNCSSEPVSVRCQTDNLALCQECDWDAHGGCAVSSSSSSHDRILVEGISDCPSVYELASVWGFDLAEKKSDESSVFASNWGVVDNSWLYDKASSVLRVEDLMVPTRGDDAHVSKMPILSCGKQKNVIYKQLTELLKRDLEKGGGGDDEDERGNVNVGNWQGSLDDEDETVGIMANEEISEQSQYMSLLMLPNLPTQNKGSENHVGGDTMWEWDRNLNNHNQTTQIWDFNSGKLRSGEDSEPFYGEYGVKDGEFMIKSYAEFLQGTSFSKSKMVKEMYQIQHGSIEHKDDNKAICLSRSQGQAKDIQFTEQSVLVNGEGASTFSSTKADLELMAQNRDNAMQRYKEKKKNRR